VIPAVSTKDAQTFAKKRKRGRKYCAVAGCNYFLDKTADQHIWLRNHEESHLAKEYKCTKDGCEKVYHTKLDQLYHMYEHDIITAGAITTPAATTAHPINDREMLNGTSDIQ